jgi:hypothetical protein
VIGACSHAGPGLPDVSIPAKLAAMLGTAVRTGVRFGDVISLSQSYGEHFCTSAEPTIINSGAGVRRLPLCRAHGASRLE